MPQTVVLIKSQKEELKKFEENLKWFQDNYDDLKKKFAGEYVVVNDGKVVLHGKDAKELIEKLRAKYGDIGSFVIEYVSKEKIELML